MPQRYSNSLYVTFSTLVDYSHRKEMRLTFGFLLKLLAGASFLAHILSIMKEEIIPTQTFTRFEKNNLSIIDFPVIIKICIKPSCNEEEIKKFGYRSLWGYFVGQSYFNGKIYGWAGHRENGTVFSTVQGIKIFK